MIHDNAELSFRVDRNGVPADVPACDRWELKVSKLELSQTAFCGVAHLTVDGLVTRHFFEFGSGVAVASRHEEVDHRHLDERVWFAGQGSEHAGANQLLIGMREEGIEGG